MRDAALAWVEGSRILLVEDEYIVAMEIADSLSDMGAEVLGPIARVPEVLAFLATAEPAPDAAILDVNLGGEMVYPVADVLIARGIPFVFTTGYDRSALDAAYADFARCEKPIDLRRCLYMLPQAQG